MVGHVRPTFRKRKKLTLPKFRNTEKKNYRFNFLLISKSPIYSFFFWGFRIFGRPEILKSDNVKNIMWKKIRSKKYYPEKVLGYGPLEGKSKNPTLPEILKAEKKNYRSGSAEELSKIRLTAFMMALCLSNETETTPDP